MTPTREGIIAYQVTFYHDEPEEAAADTFSWSKAYRSESGAMRAARTSLNSHWQTATVHKGTYYYATNDRDSEWELDYDSRPLIVGPDWTDR